jgi:predicted molibdopterin-dependent oxidoreductase YjgC
MKKRLREGAKLIVLDPCRIDLARTPHVEADYHLPLQPIAANQHLGVQAEAADLN